jgi:carbamoyl-phosphate synthase large subunit
MKTILLTAIGGDIAQGVAAIIREAYPEWRIVGVDMNERHGGRHFVDGFHRAPAASHPEFVAWLTALIDSEKADVCWPISESELSVIGRHRLKRLGEAHLITPGFKAIAAGNDKLATADLLAELGIKGPWTRTVEAGLEDVALPCVYKPRSGAGSKAVFTCSSIEEATFYARHYPGGVFQELLLPADREVTCAVFRSRDRRVVVLPLLRQLTGGLTGWACAIEDEAITDQCARIADALDLSGAMNVQLRLTDAGPRIFEINARVSSTALIRHRMGFEDVVWTLKDLLGEPVAFKLPAPGTIGVRIQDAIVFHPERQEGK